MKFNAPVLSIQSYKCYIITSKIDRISILSAFIFHCSFKLTRYSSCGAKRLPTLPQNPQCPMATPRITVGNSSDAYRNIVQKPLTATPLPMMANAVTVTPRNRIQGNFMYSKL